jgi:hypothetical protein
MARFSRRWNLVCARFVLVVFAPLLVIAGIAELL